LRASTIFKPLSYRAVLQFKKYALSPDNSSRQPVNFLIKPEWLNPIRCAFGIRGKHAGETRQRPRLTQLLDKRNFRKLFAQLRTQIIRLDNLNK
jgi:hypothetical protein